MEIRISSHDDDCTLRVAANTIVALIEARKADRGLAAWEANASPESSVLARDAEAMPQAASHAPSAAVIPPPPASSVVPPPTTPLPPPPVSATGARDADVAAGVELDSAGHAWDERIHSSSKEKVKDGTWRKRRNTGGATVEAPVAVAVPLPPAPSASPELPLPPPPPPLPDAAPAAPGPKVYPTSVPTLMPLVTAATTSGRVTMVQIAEACQTLGIPNGLGGFATNPELIPFFCDALGLV